MKYYSAELVFSLLILCMTTLIFSYMQWCKEYDSKIVSITRNVYTIKIENGKSITIIKDDIEK